MLISYRNVPLLTVSKIFVKNLTVLLKYICLNVVTVLIEYVNFAYYTFEHCSKIAHYVQYYAHKYICLNIVTVLIEYVDRMKIFK